jgi:long-chain acyl-CoA synthetase
MTFAVSDAPKTPLEMLYQWEKQTPDKIFLRQPKALQWTESSWAQVADSARRVAAFIGAQGYPAGSRIALWSGNTADWIVVDLAIMMAGHVSVPLYPGQDVESARYIFEHSDSKLLFVGGFDQFARADEAIPAGVPRVAMLGSKIACAHSLVDILATTAPISGSPVQAHDALMTLVYTSGTTGNPKGVMHIHGTPALVCPDFCIAFKHETGVARFFSYLPMSHIAERILVEMNALYSNGTVSFSEGLATFADELRSVQPTFFFSVPRLWIKFKEGVDAKIPHAAQAHLTPEQKKGIAHQLGFASATMIITGSAPCPRDVQQWFLDMGIILRDGYGMTENCIHGVGWVQDDNPKPGCVGKPFSDKVKVKLSDDGEILFSSDALMVGYYREPEKTAEVLRDGWYYTGDAGRFDEDGNLWITGRVSEVFKTTKGKFVRPSNIEDLFGRSDLLAQFCVFGHGLDQPAIVVTLSESGKKISHESLTEQLGALLNDINGEIPPWEKIPRICVAKEEWTIDNGLLTPTMKIKRKAIEKLYLPLVTADHGKASVVIE